MRFSGWVVSAAAVLVLAGSAADAQNSGFSGQGTAVITVLPNKPGEQSPNISAQDVKEIKVGNKPAEATRFAKLGANNPVELVFLIDASARSNLGSQMGAIRQFVQEMPSNAQMAIAYMQNGTARFTQPLSSNPSQVLKALRATNGPVDASASPYFCLSDLAKHWPSKNADARRIAVVISDGIDYYDLHYDPEDPYVRAAIHDSVRNHLIVYFLYWADIGRASRLGWEQSAGENLMSEVTDATGGYSYWKGIGNPVSFAPYFKDLRHRLNDQFGVGFAAQLNGGNEKVEAFSLKLSVPNAKIDAPKQVVVVSAGAAQQ